MGADFLYAIMPACDLTEDRKAEALKHIEAIIPSMDADELEQFGADSTVETVLEGVRSILDDYNTLGQYRDISLLNLDSRGPTYFISGGMSHGDSPTDSFDTLNQLEYAGLFPMLERWSKQDAQARRKSRLASLAA